jgi:hypothetical protein
MDHCQSNPKYRCSLTTAKVAHRFIDVRRAMFVQRVGGCSGESLGGGALRCRSPHWGTTLELTYMSHEKSLGENIVHLWMSVSGAISVTSSLEASLLETELGLWCWCVANDGRRWPWLV